MARTLAAEMHASFQPLREACPMNLRRAYVGFEPSPAVLADLPASRRCGRAARAARGADGPWLFGAYSLADVFFAPVATRIATYGLPVGAEGAAYVAAHLADAAFLDWRAEGLADPFVQAALRPRPAGAALARDRAGVNRNATAAAQGSPRMVAHAYTVAFQGVEARLVEVQCAIAAGLPAFNLVGCPTRRSARPRSGSARR